MHIDPLFGPVLPEHNWVPAPSYLMRRARVLNLLAGCRPGRLLEVGCGAGALLHELQCQGFNCSGVETSIPARAIASAVNPDIPVLAQFPAECDRFDYLLALEVLEHIEDDRAALADWRLQLKSDGLLLLSVPAHQSKWTESDVWAGHYRRYEKAGLLQLLDESGFEVKSVENWGFPLSNLLLAWRARLHRRQLAAKTAADDRDINNQYSGIDREAVSGLYPLLASPPGRLAMRCAFLLQHVSRRHDWGIGYLISARRK